MENLHEELLKVFASQEYKKIHNDLNIELQKRLMERIHVVESRCTALEAENKHMKTTIKRHEEELEKMKTTLQQKEKQQKRNNLKVSGVQEEENENTKEKVRNFLRDSLKLEIKADDIQCAERMGVRRKQEPNARRTQTTSRPILIKFNNYWVRREVYRERFQLKSLKDRVFINEDLPPEQATLFFEARQLVKKNILASAWTWEGDVYVKVKKDDKKGELVKNLTMLSYYGSDVSDRMRLQLSKSDSVSSTSSSSSTHDDGSTFNSAFHS